MSRNYKLDAITGGIHGWMRLFELLSLDLVEEFLPRLGLSVANSHALRHATRNCLNEFRNRSEDVSEWAVEQDQQLLDRAFTSLSEASPETAKAVYEYGTGEYIDEDLNGGAAFIWRTVLTRWVIGEPPLDDPPFEHAKVQVIRVIAASRRELDELEEEIERQESRPISSWDQGWYSLRDEELGLTPFDQISELGAFHWFRRAWNDIKSLLTDEEKAKLLDWARSQSAKIEAMTPDLIELPS